MMDKGIERGFLRSIAAVAGKGAVNSVIVYLAAFSGRNSRGELSSMNAVLGFLRSRGILSFNSFSVKGINNYNAASIRDWM